MHGPDGDRERKGRAREQQPPAQALGAADLHRKAEPDIGALDRHHQRERDEPGLVRHRHRPLPFSSKSLALGLAQPPASTNTNRPRHRVARSTGVAADTRPPPTLPRNSVQAYDFEGFSDRPQAALKRSLLTV